MSHRFGELAPHRRGDIQRLARVARLAPRGRGLARLVSGGGSGGGDGGGGCGSRRGSAGTSSTSAARRDVTDARSMRIGLVEHHLARRLLLREVAQRVHAAPRYAQLRIRCQLEEAKERALATPLATRLAQLHCLPQPALGCEGEDGPRRLQPPPAPPLGLYLDLHLDLDLELSLHLGTLLGTLTQLLLAQRLALRRHRGLLEQRRQHSLTHQGAADARVGCEDHELRQSLRRVRRSKRHVLGVLGVLGVPGWRGWRGWRGVAVAIARSLRLALSCPHPRGPIPPRGSPQPEERTHTALDEHLRGCGGVQKRYLRLAPVQYTPTAYVESTAHPLQMCTCPPFECTCLAPSAVSHSLASSAAAQSCTWHGAEAASSTVSCTASRIASCTASWACAEAGEAGEARRACSKASSCRHCPSRVVSCTHRSYVAMSHCRSSAVCTSDSRAWSASARTADSRLYSSAIRTRLLLLGGEARSTAAAAAVPPAVPPAVPSLRSDSRSFSLSKLDIRRGSTAVHPSSSSPASTSASASASTSTSGSPRSSWTAPGSQPLGSTSKGSGVAGEAGGWRPCSMLAASCIWMISHCLPISRTTSIPSYTLRT
eukprot:scaffold96781_cov54-Phaeocystis_antarctica.AAC.2